MSQELTTIINTNHIARNEILSLRPEDLFPSYEIGQISNLKRQKENLLKIVKKDIQRINKYLNLCKLEADFDVGGIQVIYENKPIGKIIGLTNTKYAEPKWSVSYYKVSAEVLDKKGLFILLDLEMRINADITEALEKSKQELIETYGANELLKPGKLKQDGKPYFPEKPKFVTTPNKYTR